MLKTLMPKTSKSIFPVFILTSLIWIIFSSVLAQEISPAPARPLPPPIDIEFDAETTPIAGEETELKLKIIPLENMHTDISCLLPQGVEPVREEGAIVQPCRQEHLLYSQPETIYIEAIRLWVGPLKANIAKEFTFRVIIPDKQKYELIARVEALAKWGVKEVILTIDIN